MENREPELEQLRNMVRELLGRVYRLERAVGAEALSRVPEAAEAASVAPRAEVPGSAPARVAATSTIAPRRAGPEGSLESRIGSQWLNRIGIVAVLVGVSYFLKYAFDNNWIGPAGRVAIGLVAGIAVVLWSERFRQHGYPRFSYSLKAVGIGALYLSLWAGFQVYRLLPAPAAFLAMVLVTASTAVLALTQEAEILAAFALIGGFVTPVLLSTGQNREVQLFAYVTVLDLATLMLLSLRPWRRLLVLSFAGTLTLYLGWYLSFYTRPQLPTTLGFATLFFLIFAAAPMVAGTAGGSRAVTSAVLPFLALSNAVVYFAQVYVILEEVNTPVIAWFALALAGSYIFLARYGTRIDRSSTAARTLRFLHLALAIGFITVAIPIRLETHWITIGWFMEAAVLLWVAQRLESNFLGTLAAGALILGVARLLFVDNFHPTYILFNARMATHGIAIAVLGAIVWYGSRHDSEAWKSGAAMALVALNLLALIAMTREANDYFSRQVAILPRSTAWSRANFRQFRSIEVVRDFTYSAIWMAYGGGLMFAGFWRRSAFVRWQALILIAATTCKVFLYDVSQLERGYRVLSFIVLGALLLAISFLYQRDWLKLSSSRRAASPGSAPPQSNSAKL